METKGQGLFFICLTEGIQLRIKLIDESVFIYLRISQLFVGIKKYTDTITSIQKIDPIT